jgi:hypothetical protein
MNFFLFGAFAAQIVSSKFGAGDKKISLQLIFESAKS